MWLPLWLALCFCLGLPGTDFTNRQWQIALWNSAFLPQFTVSGIWRTWTVSDVTHSVRKICETIYGRWKRSYWAPFLMNLCIYLLFSLLSSFFFFINNSASCKKLVIMKTTLICRNADYSCLLECGWSWLSMEGPICRSTYIYLSILFCPHVWDSLNFGPMASSYLIPQSVKKKEISDTSSVYIRKKVMILSS